MPNQETEPTKYSQEYFELALPPNHNPIIGTSCLETINHVHDSLCYLRDAHEALSHECHDEIPRDSKDGLFWLLNCLISGLRFEMANRE